MSSFLGHSLVGASIGHLKKKDLKWAVYFAFLACLPDIEYPIYWLTGKAPEIRWGHTIGFILIAWIASGLFLKLIRAKPLKILILLSGAVLGSHLIIDYLVGVYHNPLLFPFTKMGLTSPFGILPSAGKLDLSNYFFWRNSLIEMGILIPLILTIQLFLKRKQISHPLLKIIFSLFISVPFLIWSISLGR